MTVKTTIPIILLVMGMIAFPVAAQDESKPEQQDNPPSISDLTKEITSQVRAGKAEAAAETLNQGLAQATDEEDIDRLQKMRQAVASAFMRTRDYKGASEQMKLAVEYFKTRFDDSAARAQVLGAARTYAMLASRTGNAEAAYQMVAELVEKMNSMEAEGEVTDLTIGMSRLMSALISSPTLADNSERKQALTEQLKASLDRVDTFLKENPDDTLGIQSFSSLLSNASQLFSDQESLAAEYAKRRMEFLSDAVERNEGQPEIAAEFLSAISADVAGSYRDDPEGAQQKIDMAREKLEGLEDNPMIGRMLSQMASYEARIEAALKLAEMIGQPAPELDIAAWVNNEEANASLESLEGKVVLLDFWAVWCGPCIATFPHLRELREEFHDDGFEIVGVSRYYGYRWDEEAGKAVRGGGEEVSEEVENEAVAKFLQSKDMEHPSIMAPKDSDMSQRFGVTGIPHAVVLDRQGRVQLIKVGSGEANARAIREKIQALLAEEG